MNVEAVLNTSRFDLAYAQIGLAVGDIETVRRNAQLKRLTMQVRLHTDLERKLPKKILAEVDKTEVFIYPNQKGSGNLCVSGFFNLAADAFCSKLSSRYLIGGHNRPNTITNMRAYK